MKDFCRKLYYIAIENARKLVAFGLLFQILLTVLLTKIDIRCSVWFALPLIAVYYIISVFTMLHLEKLIKNKNARFLIYLAFWVDSYILVTVESPWLFLLAIVSLCFMFVDGPHLIVRALIVIALIAFMVVTSLGFAFTAFEYLDLDKNTELVETISKRVKIVKVTTGYAFSPTVERKYKIYSVIPSNFEIWKEIESIIAT